MQIARHRYGRYLIRVNDQLCEAKEPVNRLNTYGYNPEKYFQQGLKTFRKHGGIVAG